MDWVVLCCTQTKQITRTKPLSCMFAMYQKIALLLWRYVISNGTKSVTSEEVRIMNVLAPWSCSRTMIEGHAEGFEVSTPGGFPIKTWRTFNAYIIRISSHINGNKSPRAKHHAKARCEAYPSMYITYISVSILTKLAVAGPHWQLVSVL